MKVDMNISLTPDLEEYIDAQLKSGHYRSSSEVVREALRNQIRQSMSQKLEQRLNAGRQQVEAGLATRADEKYFDGKREKIRQETIDNDQSS